MGFIDFYAKAENVVSGDEWEIVMCSREGELFLHSTLIYDILWKYLRKDTNEHYM